MQRERSLSYEALSSSAPIAFTPDTRAASGCCCATRHPKLFNAKSDLNRRIFFLCSSMTSRRRHDTSVERDRNLRTMSDRTCLKLYLHYVQWTEWNSKILAYFYCTFDLDKICLRACRSVCCMFIEEIQNKCTDKCTASELFILAREFLRIACSLPQPNIGGFDKSF